MAIHKYAFLERDFVEFKDAKISVMTHAFLYGTAVFEGIRAYWNKDRKKLYGLFVNEHLARLENSSKLLRIQPYYSLEEMKEIIIELLQKNSPTNDSYVRPSWFKSSLRIGPGLISPNGEPEDSFVVSSLDLGEYLNLSKGLSVMVSSWRRISDNAIPPRAKINGSYVNTALSKSNATLAGFDDAIFLNENGYVSEGSAMNLFIVRNGKLITSGVQANILEGITRNFVMEIAKNELGLETEIREIGRTELYVAEEAFFVGTGAQIAAIGKIDNYLIADGDPGPICKKLQELYFEITQGLNPKYSHVLTEISL
jgi:branched-chain amino acid aminotransferase